MTNVIHTLQLYGPTFIETSHIFHLVYIIREFQAYSYLCYELFFQMMRFCFYFFNITSRTSLIFLNHNCSASYLRLKMKRCRLLIPPNVEPDILKYDTAEVGISAVASCKNELHERYYTIHGNLEDRLYMDRLTSFDLFILNIFTVNIYQY